MALTIGTGITIGGGITFHRITPPEPWTWDPGYLGTPGLVLSNGDLVVTAISTQNDHEPSVLGTYPIPANSKVMFSVCALAVTTTDVSGVGVGSHAMDLTTFIGADYATSQGVYEDGGNYTQTQSPAPTGLTYDSLYTIDVAIDRVNGLFWYRTGYSGALSDWNNDAGADPATATGGYPISDLVGTVYPAVSPYYNPGQSVPPAFSMAGAFGANSDPGGAVPAGFTFIAARAPAWYWNLYLSGPMSTTFSGRTVYDNEPGVFTALGSYAVGDTARVVYSVQLSYDLDPGLPQNQAVGFGLNSTVLTNSIGIDTNSIGVLNTGEVYFNGIQVYSGLPTFVAGDVIDIALVGSYITPGWWYRVNGGYWNGNPEANPTTNTGGLSQFVDDTSSPLYPAVSIGGETGPSVFTIQDVPVYPVPTGFTFLGTSQVRTMPTPILSFDSGNPASYPGSGNTWYDLAGSDNATLPNGATYSAANGGILTFNRSLSQSAHAAALSTLTTFTAETWVKFNALELTTGNATCTITDIYNSTPINYTIGCGMLGNPSLWQGGYFDGGAWHLAGNFVPVIDTWYCMSVTYDGSNINFYVNGELNDTVASAVTPGSSGLGIHIGERWDGSYLTQSYVDGSIPIVRLYDTALTSLEIKQNFDVDKTRFGL